MALIVGLLYRNIGLLDGCPNRPNEKFDPADLEVIQNAIKAQSGLNYDNCGGLIGLLLLNLYTTLIATAFTFPSEMSTLVKEQSNGWYKVASYFMGKSLADVPIQVACPLVSGIPSYFLMGQNSDPFRLLGVISIQVLVSLISQSQGLLVGALFVSAAGAVYFAPMTMTPLFLFGGYVISKSSMPLIYQTMMYASYVYYGFQATFSFVYGFDRCGSDVAQKTLALHRSMTDWFAISFGIELDSDNRNVTSPNKTGTGISTKFLDSITNIVAGDYIRDKGKVKSLPLITFQVFDEMYWIHILMLIVLVFAMRVAAFLVKRFQVKRLQ